MDWIENTLNIRFKTIEMLNLQIEQVGPSTAAGAAYFNPQPVYPVASLGWPTNDMNPTAAPFYPAGPRAQ